MTQSMAVQASVEIPAVAYELGDRPLAIHQGRNTARWLNVACFLVVATVGFWGGIYLLSIDDGRGLLGFPLGLVCLICGLYEGYRTIIERDLCVIVMAEGLVISMGGQHTVFRWEDIEEVWESIWTASQYGVKVKTIYKYTVRRRNSKKIVFTDTVQDIAKLGSTIEKEVTRRRLSQAHEALNAGQALDFGKVGVSRSGIIIRKKTTPWNQVRSIKVNEGFIIIDRERTHLNWVVKVGDIPNVYVFLTLVNLALGARNSGYK